MATQFIRNTILQRAAALISAALSIDVVPRPGTLQRTPPFAYVTCPVVERETAGVKHNGWRHTIYFAGTFPFPASGTIEADQDAKAEAVYDALISSDEGYLLAADGTTLLLYGMQCTRLEVLLPEVETDRYYTLVMEFTGFNTRTYR